MNNTTRSEGDPRPTPLLRLVGHFAFEGARYAVVELQGDRKDFTETVPGSDHASTVCRFKIGGRGFAIVLADAVQPDGERDPLELLTEREVQIATLVAMGRLNKQIADQLRISEWTVATHLRRIFAKLCVDTRAAMVYRCASLIGRRNP